MAQTRMLGVVLWCDAADSKAIIWCEDHGKLAYYTPSMACAHSGEAVAEAGLDAGDLVRFDLTEEDQLRFALNPEVLSEVAYPSIAQSLAPREGYAAGTGLTSHAQNKPMVNGHFDAGTRPAPANSDSVIEFSNARRMRTLATA